MRDETKRRLDRQLFLQKVKWTAAGVAILAGLGGGLWVSGLDASVETHHVSGVVEAVGPLVGGSSRSIENGLGVDVRLHDGRRVHVAALKTTDPHVGDNVEVAEHVHGSGRVTFTWK
jgi:multidrug efflux pump subunit AcrA (membrane-fusion protein)